MSGILKYSLYMLIKSWTRIKVAQQFDNERSEGTSFCDRTWDNDAIC